MVGLDHGSGAELLRFDPLPSPLREFGCQLLAGHWQTVDRDRLLSVYVELTASLLRTADGAVVELGCYKGAMSAWIRAVIDFCGSDRSIHVFDSFEGLPEPGAIDGDHLARGDVKASLDDVVTLHHAHGLTPPVIHPGWFADTLGELPESIAFAYVDADFYDSMAVALEAVLPRLAHGGALVLDDYADLDQNPRAWPELPGVKRAWDDVSGGRLDIDVILGAGDLAFGVYRAPGRARLGADVGAPSEFGVE